MKQKNPKVMREARDFSHVRFTQSLTGLKASELRVYVGAKDDITRDALEQRVNKALDTLQTLNTSLLMSDLDFEFRKNVIKTTCKNKYPHLYIGKLSA